MAAEEQTPKGRPMRRMFGPLYASLTAATFGLAAIVLVRGDARASGVASGEAAPLILWWLGTVAVVFTASVLAQYLRVARRVYLTLLVVVVAVSVVGFAVTRPPDQELQRRVMDLALSI